MSKGTRTFFNPHSFGKLLHSLAETDVAPPDESGYLRLEGGEISGDIDMNQNGLKGLPEPTLNGDAATKNYVDSKHTTTVAVPATAIVEWHFSTGTTVLHPVPPKVGLCFSVVPLQRESVIKVVTHTFATTPDDLPMAVSFYLRYIDTNGAQTQLLLGERTYATVIQTADALAVSVVNHDFDLSELIDEGDPDPVCGYLAIKTTDGTKRKSLIMVKIVN